MKNGLVLLVLLILLLALACESENSSNKVAEEQNQQKFDSTKLKEDAEFAVKASSSCWLEIEMGKFASTAAASADVKKFGQTMAEAHGKVNEQLKSLAAARNISLPSVPDNDKQKRMDDLKKKTGAEFDSEYIAMMIRSHKEDIEAFQKELDKGSDPEIKTWAKELLPVLHHHLQMAEDIEKNVKSKKQ